MTFKKPDIKRKFTATQFKEEIAKYARELDQWITLSVDAFEIDDAARAERLRKVRDPETGYRFFVETYLPHYVRGDASLFHEAVFERMPQVFNRQEGGARELFIAPRGSSKSTHLSLGYAIYCVAMGAKKYIIEVCDVYEQAALLLEGIKAELTSNPRLKHDFPEICGEGRVWREASIVTRNGVRIEGLGANKKIRGRRHGPHRPDLLFLDDIENDENVQSPDQRRKLEDWIDKAALKVGPPDGSLDAIYVGTIIHFDAVLARKAKSPAWHTTKFQAIVEWPGRMDLWEEFEEVYHNDGPDAAKAFYVDHKAAMDECAVVNWPSIQPLVWLMMERAGSHSAFATEYQNQPISEENPFKKIAYWVQAKSNLIHFGAIDPSLGKKGRAGKGGDPSAILIGGFDPVTGEMDLLEASIRRRLADVIISDAIALQKIYRCHLWFVEAVQFQEFFRTTLIATAVKQGVPFPAMPITPYADKALRIQRLQVPIKDGQIRLHPAQTTLIEQLQQWPNAAHDDGPDALDMVWTNGVEYSRGLGSYGGGSGGGINVAGGGGRSSDDYHGSMSGGNQGDYRL